MGVDTQNDERGADGVTEVSSSPRKITARKMVMSGEMVEIFEVARGELRGRHREGKAGSAVTNKAQSATRRDLETDAR